MTGAKRDEFWKRKVNAHYKVHAEDLNKLKKINRRTHGRKDEEQHFTIPGGAARKKAVGIDSLPSINLA